MFSFEFDLKYYITFFLRNRDVTQSINAENKIFEMAKRKKIFSDSAYIPMCVFCAPELMIAACLFTFSYFFNYGSTAATKNIFTGI